MTTARITLAAPDTRAPIPQAAPPLSIDLGPASNFVAGMESGRRMIFAGAVEISRAARRRRPTHRAHALAAKRRPLSRSVKTQHALSALGKKQALLVVPCQ
jgi:hypothetical protein